MRSSNEQEVLDNRRRQHYESPEDVESLLMLVSSLIRNGLNEEAICVLDNSTQYFLDHDLATPTYIKIRNQFEKALNTKFSHQERKKRRIQATQETVLSWEKDPTNDELMRKSSEIYQSISENHQQKIQRIIIAISQNLTRNGHFTSLEKFKELFPDIPIIPRLVNRGLLKPFHKLLPDAQERFEWLTSSINGTTPVDDEPITTHPNPRNDWERTLDDLFSSYQNDPLIISCIQYYEQNAFHQNPYREETPYKNRWVSELEITISSLFRSLAPLDLYKALVLIEKAVAGEKLSFWKKCLLKKCHTHLNNTYLQDNHCFYSERIEKSIPEECLEKIAQLFPQFYKRYKEKKRKQEEKQQREKREWEARIQNLIFNTKTSTTSDNTED